MDKLRILYVEDNPVDADLVLLALEQAGIEASLQCVMTEEDFTRAVRESEFDLIFSSYSLSQFNGLLALGVALQECPQTPFIMISGTVSEEIEIESVNKGATDYVLKHQLYRLALCVRKALQESRERFERRRAEQVLRQREEDYRKLFDHNPSPMWIYDEEKLNILDVNLAAIQHYGYSRNEFLGMTVKELRPAEDVTRYNEYYHATRDASKSPVRFATAGLWRHLKKDGTIIHVEVTWSSVQFGNRNARLALINDVTERLEAEKRIVQLSRVIEQAADLVLITDKDGIIQYVNSSFESGTGYTKEEVIGKTPRILKSGIHDVEFYRDLWETILSGNTFGATVVNKKKNGEMFYEEQTIAPLKDSEGRITHFVSTGKDVTRLEHVTRQLKYLFDTLDEIFFSVEPGPVPRILYVSPACEKLFGIPQNDFRQDTFLWRKVIHKDDLKAVERAERLLKRGKNASLECRVVRPDGQIRWVEIHTKPTMSPDRSVLRLDGFISDITDRKNSEMTLADSEKRYRTLFENSKDAVYISTVAGRFLEVNTAMVELCGYAREELLHMNITDTLYWSVADRDEFKRSMETEGYVKDYETRLKTKAGELRITLESASALRDDQGRIIGYQGVLKDITARKESEERLVSQYAVTRVLAEAETLEEAAPGILKAICEGFNWLFGTIWLVDPLQNQLRCAGTWSAGETLEEFESVTRGLTFAGGEGVPGVIWKEEKYFWFPDFPSNSSFPRAELVEQLGLRATVAFPIRGSKEVKGVMDFFAHEMKKPDEDLVRMMYALGSQIGQFIERKISDEAREALERQFTQAQKMEAIGQLAGGIAHDFNNTLMAITSYSELLLLKMGQDDALRTYISEILKAGNQGAALTRQLLAFSRRQVLTPRTLDLNEVIGNMQDMLKRLIGEDVDLVTVPASDLGTVEADLGQIQQVLMNLAVNARDAMQREGALTVETANAELDLEYAVNHVGVKPGHYVMMSITDTGTGMNEATLAHIFDPFFTTKEEGKGTGLGLSTVYGIVKQSSGHISVYSQEGQGTTFKIYLPRIDAPVKHIPDTTLFTEVAGHGETILLVDDNETIRGSISAVLEIKGYKVLQASNGRQALEIAEDAKGRINLLISDIVMPGMNGLELTRRLKEQYPHLRVLYMSGYADEAIRRQGSLEEGSTFLSKPATMQVLLQTVHGLLKAKV